MKKIGFIDYFLNEWHADNYPRWIHEASNGEMEVAYAYGQVPSPVTGMTSAQWCEKMGVSQCDTIGELIEKSDYIVVLSPDNCEMHYELSHQALASGKCVYVDKTFAKNKAEAVRIFNAAKTSPCFSSSALRFSEKLGTVEKTGVQTMLSVGPGEPDNYIIHQLEPIAVVMGTDVQTVSYTGSKSAHSWTLRFADGRTALVNMLPDASFESKVVYENATRNVIIDDAFFNRFIEAMVEFFRTGKAPVERETTIAIMAIREACLKAMETPGSWIAV